MIAKGNQYLESALETLEIISQDEQKRIAYTARQKALYDFNEQMSENYDRGKSDATAAFLSAMQSILSKEQIQEVLRKMSEQNQQ